MPISLRSSTRGGPPTARSIRTSDLDLNGTSNIPTTGDQKKKPRQKSRAVSFEPASGSTPDVGQSDASLTSGTGPDEDEEDDGDDESDQPAANAPSCRKRQGRKAGRPKKVQQAKIFSSTDQEMFVTSELIDDVDPAVSDFEVASSEEDDDAIYQQVEYISDDDDQVEQYEEDAMLGEYVDDANLMFLTGLSDSENVENYGLGEPPDDFSTESTSEDSAAGNASLQVRDLDSPAPVEPVTALTTLKARSTVSPPESTLTSPIHPTTFLDMDPDYDSDKTDEDVPRPSTAHPSALTFTPSQTRKSVPKKKSGRKGPPMGLFSIDPNQSWSTLDETRTKILIMPRADTGSHDWLDECRERTRDASLAATMRSPSSSLSAFDFYTQTNSSSQNSIDQTMVTGAVNPIMAGLIHGQEGTHDGSHITGPPEAFNPLSLSTQFNIGDYLLDPEDDLGQLLDDNEDPEVFKTVLEPFVKFEDSSDEEDEEQRPSTSMGPPQTPPVHNRTRSSSAFAHLNNLDSELVTAFRRQNSIPPSPTSSIDYSAAFTPGHALMRDAYQNPQRALSRLPRGHKRKASHEVYQSSHYNGVTPVGRKILKTSHRLKRRKTTA